jgi:hypothetical protein
MIVLDECSAGHQKRKFELAARMCAKARRHVAPARVIELLVIEFLQAENRLLKERLRGKRVRFTDAERALLARKAKTTERKTLLELDTIGLAGSGNGA